jgi:hypothetical protein
MGMRVVLKAKTRNKNWTRIDDGRSKLGATYVHRSGWRIYHCFLLGVPYVDPAYGDS